jgi:hypothetical protein
MFTLMDLTKGILQKQHAQKQGNSPKADDNLTDAIPSPGSISKKSIAEDQRENI